jgi:chromosome segregation protein
MKQRLKSLELHGYKTFASKTRFEFPDQITAIVGPNGSGKSNIADAIRWVLGEQAYSLLRGKKTIDMIFAGSEHRPRASMASATIIFDNEDNWLPIEYAEVSLTRRAYRSGENEYLLNNTRVRLKEINELLANSGLSERTYTIIGQGLVDVALSLKPEERRRFFEEAAGIELYRSRRDEAIQKLDNTLRNMDRVRDILSELGPRLKSLEKQSERAKEYDRIKADLFIYLRDWYGYQWNKIQEELTDAMEFYEQQQAVLNSAREKQVEISRTFEKIREQINKNRADLTQWHKESADLHQNEENFVREIAVLSEREKAIQDKGVDFNRELTYQEERLSNRKKQLDDWTDEKNKKAEDLKKVQALHAGLNQSIAARSEQRQTIESDIKNIRSSIEAMETRQIQIRAQKDEIGNRIAIYEKNIADLNASKELDKVNLEKLEKETEHQQENTSKKKEEIAQSDKRIKEIERHTQEATEKIKNSRVEISRLEASHLSKNAQLEIVENAEQTLSGFTSGSKSLFSAARSGQLSGKYVLLLSQIRTPVEYETAIASVLGDLLESLILDDAADPEKVLKFIEDNDSGRTALLVRSWIKTMSSTYKLSQETDVIAAKDVVNAKEPYQSVVQALLHNVIIVKDRKIARKLMPELGTDIRLVTLQGEVFFSNGLVIAGKEARVKAISRTREKEELIAAVKEVQSAILLYQKRLVAEEQHLLTLEDELKIEKGQREVHQKSIDELITVFNNLLTRKSQINTRLEWISSQISSLSNQIKQGHEEKEKNSLEGTDLNKQVEEKSKENSQLFSQIKDLPMEALQEELYFVNAQKAIEEQTARNLDGRIGEIRQEIESIMQEKEKTTSKINDNENNLHDVRETKNELTIQVHDFGEKLGLLKEKITPVETELAEQEMHDQKMQQEQDQSRQQFVVIERHTIQAQMKLNRVRDQQDNLKRRIEEDFGLVFYEYGQTVEGPTPLPIEGMVENLPKLAQIPETLEENIKQQKSILRRMGPINPEAQKEYREVQERHVFITEQLKDLEKAEGDLRQVVKELDELMKTEFQKTFRKVNDEFKEIFKKLFGGGTADLVIEDEENLTESGIDIEATLPGKRKQELASLSGGERSLTAVALIFALLKVSPTPFCILDEVDAMLDESNVMRFGELLRDLSQTTQFIVITHNRNTVQLANVLYGVTMGKDSTSQVISLKLDELTEELVQ